MAIVTYTWTLIVQVISPPHGIAIGVTQRMDILIMQLNIIKDSGN